MRVYDTLFAAVAKAVAFIRTRLSATGGRRPLLRATVGHLQNGKLARRVAVVLIVALLAAATPSAPSTVSSLTQKLQTGVNAWARSSSPSARLLRSVSGSSGRYRRWLFTRPI